jgi:S1-C subfamily serine protease
VILACACAGSSVAQDRAELGPLLPAGDSARSAPGAEKYSLDTTTSLPGGSKLGPALDRVAQPEPPLRLRGAREIELYRTLVPSVALILTDKAEGSGSLIAMKPLVSTNRSGTLLTNAHVVGDATEVAVVFKPQKDGEKITQAHALRGRVRKVDPVRDLALVEVENVPARAGTIPLGTFGDVQVGADVHAIGHPLGQEWTYTKGLVSQIRPAYEWGAGSTKHVADVIQTQTPISPGNSGGPLISDDGKLVGVNSFKTTGGEALNFAVAVNEVEKFLAAAAGGAYEPKPVAAKDKPCEGKVTYEGRTKDDIAFIRNIDMDCSGQANATLYIPDDKTQAVVLRVDTNKDGKTDAWILDENRDGKWDISYWDTDFDGKPDMVGHHPDGDLKPTKMEKYQPKS